MAELGKEKKDAKLPYKVKNLQVEINEEKEEKKDDKISKEILCIIGLLVGFMLLISIYSSNKGYLGDILFKVLVSLFGAGTYILPFIIIFLSIYFYFIKEKIKKDRFIYGICIFAVLVSLFHIIKSDNDVVAGKTFAETIFDTANKSGGLIGAIFGNIQLSFFGRTGSILFDILVLFILFVLITGKNLLELIVFVWMFIVTRIKKEFKHVFSSTDDDDGDGDDPPDGYMGGGTGKPDDFSKPKPKRNKLFEFIIGDYDEDDFPDENDDEYFKTIESDNPEDDEDDIMLPTQFKEPKESHEESTIKPSELFGSSNLVHNQENEIKSDKSKSEESYLFSDKYKLPPLNLLNKNTASFSKNYHEQTRETKDKLQKTLSSFGVDAKVNKAFRGPTVTRYEIIPGEGVKVSKISSLSDDIALNLAAPAIRIEAPIPGKAAVGIEIPNKESQTVFLREVVESNEFKNFPSKLTFALGKDIEGNVVVFDIAKMPHLLIAGATGSGKSVCINTLILSILYKASPDEVKLIMIDPKVVELSIYNGIPHLFTPVVSDPKKAAGALNWAVTEMTNRYKLFSEASVRDMTSYNKYKLEKNETDLLPQIVIIIDELADLMMTAQSEVEDCIGRLAQMARAAGIHLIIATQRPSVDVITGVIKANIPSRLAFAVSSGTDSRTILDMAGAEKLLGKGDMLFYPMGMSKPQRIQGAFISDKEVEAVVEYLKKQATVEYNEEIGEAIDSNSKQKTSENDIDVLLDDTIEFVVKKEKASASLLQRQFRVGYNRASRIIEELENRGIVGPEDGSKPRKVLWTTAQFEDYKNNKGKEE